MVDKLPEDKKRSVETQNPFPGWYCRDGMVQCPIARIKNGGKLRMPLHAMV